MTLTPQVLTDCRIYLDSVDLTGWSNKVSTSATVEDLDKTTFASGGAKERVGGLFDMSATVDGFWDAGDLTKPDDMFWADLGSSSLPLTVVPTSGAAGSLAYLSKVLEATYKPGADHGKLLAWSADLHGNWPLVRGLILHPQGTARTASGSGTAQQIGALGSTQALYVTLHVLSVSGTGTPTLTVAIESDDNSGFTSTTQQGLFTAATAVGGQTMKIVGPITDNYWRATWTISGTNPSFLFAVAAGIATK